MLMAGKPRLYDPGSYIRPQISYCSYDEVRGRPIQSNDTKLKAQRNFVDTVVA